jgi:hypothetical protein
MASSAEQIRRFASKCHELASTCTTSFARDALIDAAECVERELYGKKIQRGARQPARPRSGRHTAQGARAQVCHWQQRVTGG